MNHLNELMIERNLTQKEISIIVGVSRPTVSDWVNNKKDPKGENLQKLAAYLNVDWRDILVPKKGDLATWSTKEAEDNPKVAGLTDEDIAKVAAYIQQKQSHTENNVPKTRQARILAAGIDKMPAADRDRALEMMRLMFIDHAKYFDERNEDDDT